MAPVSIRPFLLIILFPLFSSSAKDIITPSGPLTDGETLVSNNGIFALGFFIPSNSTKRYVGIWYNNVPTRTVIWVANRRHPVTTTTASLLLVNGTLAIADNNISTIFWSSLSRAVGNPVAQLLDTGNFVVRGANENNNSELFAWQSFDYPTDTMLPGMKLGWDLNTGLNRNLTSWKSDSDPSPGDYCLAMDIRSIPQLTLFSGTKRIWRPGLWNGHVFNGMPDLNTYRDFIYRFVNTKDEIYFAYELGTPSIITRLLINESGIAQRYVWLQPSKIWNLFWKAPDTQCDQFSVCGPYGVCDSSDSRTCSCLDGFQPKSPVNWALRDGTDGCVRRTRLDCVNSTDRFGKMSNMLLPDALNATFHASMNLDDCQAKCLKNCSCTGYASAIGHLDEVGCLIWSTELVNVVQLSAGSQDLFFRVAAADLVLMPTVEQSHQNRRKIIAITVSLILGTLLMACVCRYIRRRRKRMRLGTANSPWHQNEDTDVGDDDLELPSYDLGTVIAATDNFSNENKLGEGGFGPVYKGILGERQEIAVKRLSKTSMQGIDEFKNEVVLIAKLQHRNLVRLLGCCISGEERLLLYEYMPNKSLDAFLFDKGGKTYLEWQNRFHIIKGIARGLLYLHEDSRLRIIHRDLKASNILLDKEMNPKISDFGMARIFGGDEAATHTRRVVGTYGYMSPEYAMDGIFSVKSDVFSFGVLVLEIVSGQRNKGVFHSELQSHLLGDVWRLWNEGKSLELIDPSVGSKFSAIEVIRCIKIGLLCVQERPEDRPTMSSVAVMLGSDDTSFLAPKQPGFVARNALSNPNSSSTEQVPNSVNDISLTIFTGR